MQRLGVSAHAAHCGDCSETPGGEAGEQSGRVQCRELVMHAALQRNTAGKVLICFGLKK